MCHQTDLCASANDRSEDCCIYHRIPVWIMEAYHTIHNPILVPQKMEQMIVES